jgi:hypothetical protein
MYTLFRNYKISFTGLLSHYVISDGTEQPADAPDSFDPN